MLVWTGLIIDKDSEKKIRNICKSLNKEYELNEVAFDLPQHISLKISFEADNYIEIIDYINDLLKNIKQLELKITGISKINNSVIWLDVEEIGQLRRLHTLLNTKLLENFHIPLSDLDGDSFRFHSTLFLDESISDKHTFLLKRISNLIEFPFYVKVNEICIGISELGKPGTYKIIKTIELN